MKRWFFLILLSLTLFGSIVSAEIFGYGRTESVPINYSLIPSINNSQFFNGYSVASLWTYYSGLGDALWCELTGCTMTGDIEFSDNDGTGTINYDGTLDIFKIEDAGLMVNEDALFLKEIASLSNITADTYFGDGSQLTGVQGDNSSWNESYANTQYAKYQFENNNFNGSGNLITTGTGTFSDLNVTGNTNLSGTLKVFEITTLYDILNVVGQLNGAIADFSGKVMGANFESDTGVFANVVGPKVYLQGKDISTENMWFDFNNNYVVIGSDTGINGAHWDTSFRIYDNKEFGFGTVSDVRQMWSTSNEDHFRTSLSGSRVWEVMDITKFWTAIGTTNAKNPTLRIHATDSTLGDIHAINITTDNVTGTSIRAEGGDMSIKSTNENYIFGEKTASKDINFIANGESSTGNFYWDEDGGYWVFPNETKIENNFTADFYYGEIWNHTYDGFQTIDLITPDVYVPITALYVGNLNGFTSTNGTGNLTAQIAGRYKVTLTASIGKGAVSAYGIKLFINDVGNDKCYSHFDTIATMGGIPSFSCIIYLSVGNVVQIKVDDHANPVNDPVFEQFNLNLVRIGN